MKPWVHIAHIPIYLLMLTAATASVVGIAEFRHARLHGGRAAFGISASPLSLLVGTFALVASYLFFFASLVAVGLIVGAGFGLFYLLLGAAMVMFVALPAMWIPPLARRIEALTSRQIVIGAAAVIAAAFIASVGYFIVANSLGMVIRFGDP
jgi:hypothetical protein